MKFVIPRMSRRASSLSPFVVLSLGGHAAATLILLLLPAFGRTSRIPDSSLVVDLVAVGPSKAAARAPAPTVPDPAPVEPAPTETAAPPQPSPVPPKPTPAAPRNEPKKPPKKTEPVPKPAARPPVPSPTETALPAATQPAGAAAVGPAGGGGAIVDLEQGELEFAWYRASVTTALHSQWRKPILDGLDKAIEVRVSFEIRRDGSVGGLRVEQSSGVPSLDRSALRAVADAAPLPPLPKNWSSPALEAAFVFRLHPE